MKLDTQFLILLFLGCSLLVPLKANAQIDKVKASEIIYLDCKTKSLNNGPLLNGIYKSGSTPEAFCRCIGDATAVSISDDEYTSLKKDIFSDSVKEKMIKLAQPCAVQTGS